MKVPIREGMFTEGPDGSLIGSKCRTCGHILAPLTTTCCYCRGEDLQEIELSRHGKLYSYTVVHQPHPKFGAPYSVGFIELPEGPRIFAPLKGKDFRVGMEMELLLEKLWDDNENEIIGPKFKPI
jgi:uncharacterized OB-fold protein